MLKRLSTCMHDANKLQDVLEASGRRDMVITLSADTVCSIILYPQCALQKSDDPVLQCLESRLLHCGYP